MIHRLFLLAFACLFAAGSAFAQPRADGFEANWEARVLQGFMDDPAQFGFPRLSPSGRYLSYMAMSATGGSSAQRFLVIMDLQDPTGESRQVASLDEVRPSWMEWASDDRLLVAASFEVPNLSQRAERLFGDNRPRASRVLSFSRDLSQQPVLLFSRADERLQGANSRLTSVLDYLPDDPDHVLMPAVYGGRISVFRANIVTGEAELFEEGTRRTFGWYTAKGVPVVRLEVSSMGSSVVVYSRAGPRDEWRRTQTIRFREIEEREEESEFEWAGATEEPGQILVRARPDGSDFTGIYRYDLNTGEYLEAVAERDDYDIRLPLTRAWSGEYLGYGYIADRREYHFNDPTFNAHYRGLLDYFGDQIEIHPHSFGGDRMVVRVSGPTEIGSYYLYDFETANIDPLSAIWPTSGAVTTFEVRPLAYTARDGLPISGYVTWPAGGPGPDTPLIVMPHGGPEARDRIRFNFLPQYLANQGFAVFQPNFRGSWGFGSSFVEAGHGEWGRAMQDDIEDGVRHLIANRQVDADRICIIGFSYGGYAALAGMARTPDLYKCAVAGGGVYALREFLEFKSDLSSEVYDYWVDWLGNPRDRDQRARIDAVSPVNQAGVMTGPILLMHGADDEVVPVEQSRLMSEALTRAGIRHTYLEEAGGDHRWGATDENYRIAIQNIASFLDDAIDGSVDRFQAEQPVAPDDD